jgi:hypothetical protein
MLDFAQDSILALSPQIKSVPGFPTSSFRKEVAIAICVFGSECENSIFACQRKQSFRTPYF